MIPAPITTDVPWEAHLLVVLYQEHAFYAHTPEFPERAAALRVGIQLLERRLEWCAEAAWIEWARDEAHA